MGIFDMFNTAPAAPATPATPTATPTPAAPGNIPLATDPNASPAPGTPATPVEPAAANSPLADYATLWEPIPVKEGEAAPIGPVPLDPVKLQEIVSKADFTKAITPENLAAIQAGGEGATAALIATLNTVAQQSVVQSTLAANQMQEHAIAAALKTQAATIPDLIKSQSLTNSLQENNPLFSNPAVAPIMEAVKAQLVSKNPDATPNELTTMTENFVTVLAETFSPKVAPVPGSPEAAAQEDWGKFLGVQS